MSTIESVAVTRELEKHMFACRSFRSRASTPNVARQTVRARLGENKNKSSIMPCKPIHTRPELMDGTLFLIRPLLYPHDRHLEENQLEVLQHNVFAGMSSLVWL